MLQNFAMCHFATLSLELGKRPAASLVQTSPSLQERLMLRFVAPFLILVGSGAFASADELQDCQQDRDQDLVISGCTGVIRSDPKAAWAYDKRAFARRGKRNFKQAIEDYTRAIEIDPTNIASYIGRAEAHLLNEDHDDAIADYTVAIQSSPKAVNLYISRGSMYYIKGDYDRTVADYTKAIENNSNDSFLYLLRGAVYDKRAQYDQAIADYSKALELKPDDFRAHKSRGDDYERIGDQAHATADYEAVLGLTSYSAGAFTYRNRAWALLKLRQPDQALLNVQRALDLEPNDPIALDIRGRVLENLGRRNEAIRDFQQALAINPRMTESADALSRLTRGP